MMNASRIQRIRAFFEVFFSLRPAARLPLLNPSLPSLPLTTRPWQAERRELVCNASDSFPPFFQVRLNYHSQSKTMAPGPMDLYVQYLNDTSADNGFRPPHHLTQANPMKPHKQGWQRWEAPLPIWPQLRYGRDIVYIDHVSIFLSANVQDQI